MSGRGKARQRKGKPRTTIKNNQNKGRHRNNPKPTHTNDDGGGSNKNRIRNRKPIRRKELYESNGKYKFTIALPIGADPMVIIEHINKTEGMSLSPQELSVSNAKIYFYITDQLVATSLFRLNRVKFNGQMLNIESLRDVVDKVSDKDIESLINYDSQNCILDLSNLAEKIDFNHHSIIGRLSQILSSKYANTVSLNMAKNRITTLKNFWKIARALKGLKNLSLEENELASLNEVKSLSSFRSLELLILAKNPLCWDNVAYKENIRKTFPSLKLLDMKDITTSNPFICNYFESAQQEEAIVNFVKRILDVFDKDRGQLQPIYSPTSTFSLLSGIDFRAANFSRNLLNVRDKESRMALLNRGTEQILTTFVQYATIPPTVHKLDELTIEAYMISQSLLSITIHGFLAESDTRVIRKFNRVLLISPAMPNSPAANAGWMGVIEKDVLHFGEKTN